MDADTGYGACECPAPKCAMAAGSACTCNDGAKSSVICRSDCYWYCNCAGHGGGPAAAAGSGSSTGTGSAAAKPAGCALSAASGGGVGCGNVGGSGNAALDSAMKTEFAKQLAFFNLPKTVKFAFLNDCDGPNAYADPSTMTLLYGVEMAKGFFGKYGNSLPLWQVMAHEFGHMVQFTHGAEWLSAPTVAPLELEADMFSGFYLISAKWSRSAAEMSTTIHAAFDLGEYLYNHPKHHGTPAQRMAAVVAGGKVANEYVAGKIPQTLGAVRQRFVQELTAIYP